MNPDFIKVQSLDGELKMSHKMRDYGLTLTTKELILHKPHVNYYFKLEDIINILPFDMGSLKTITIVNTYSANRELTAFSAGTRHFKLFVNASTVHNRSGIFKLGPSDVIIPILDQMLNLISECSGLTGILTD
jgi:hypothetical protein